MDTRYESWLTHHFERNTGEPAWYYAKDVDDFDAPPEVIAALLVRTLTHSGTDLRHYSNAQVGMGLDFIFNPALSGTIHAFRYNPTYFQAALNIISALKPLYADCLAQRCPSETQLLKSHDNPLQTFCFMLWDVTTFANWHGHTQADKGYTAIIDVMEYALTLPNLACIESALHGLGHLHHDRPQEVERIIQRFLRRPYDLPDNLKRYAEAAAIGYIN